MTGGKRLLLIFLPVLLLVLFAYAGAEERAAKDNKAAELLNKLENASNDRERAETLSELALELMYSRPGEALEYARQAIEIEKKINYPRVRGDCLNLYGIVYTRRGDLDEALAYFRESLDTRKKIGDRKAIAGSLNNIGLVYRNKEEYTMALEFYLRSLEIKEELGDRKGMASSYNNIGMIYHSLDDQQKALTYYNRSLKIKEAIGGNPIRIANTYYNIANSYYAIDNYRLALSYYGKSLEIREKLGDSRGVSYTCSGLGSTYFELKKYKKALEYYEKSIELAKKVKDPRGEASASHGIGLSYREMGQPEPAIQWLTKSYDLAVKSSYQHMQILAARALSETYAQTGQHEKAYKFLLVHKEKNDEVIDKENLKHITRMQLRYDLQNREKQREMELKKEKWIKYIIAAFALLLTLLAVITIRDNRLLARQKKKIQSQNEKLVQLNGFKEELTAMIVHDLKNSINTIINYSEPKTGYYPDAVRQSGLVMLNMVMNILDVQKYREARMPLEVSAQSIDTVAREALKEVAFLVGEKHIEVQNKISRDLCARMDRDIIKRVFTNLLTNAVKFSPLNGIVELDALPVPPAGANPVETVLITVTDSGEGIPEEERGNIFDRYRQITARKSGVAGSTGIGLTYCKLAVESHGGIIGVQSKPGEGTVFHFTLERALETCQTSARGESVDSGYTINLTEKEKEYIKSFLPELERLDVHELSLLMEILNRIEAPGNSTLWQWKEELRLAVFSCNAERYKMLLRFVS